MKQDRSFIGVRRPKAQGSGDSVKETEKITLLKKKQGQGGQLNDEK